MTRPRIRPSEVRQAQRWGGRRVCTGDPVAHSAAGECPWCDEAMFQEHISTQLHRSIDTLEAESDRQILERLDHNVDDLRSADEESEER